MVSAIPTSLVPVSLIMEMCFVCLLPERPFSITAPMAVRGIVLISIKNQSRHPPGTTPSPSKNTIYVLNSPLRRAPVYIAIPFPQMIPQDYSSTWCTATRYSMPPFASSAPPKLKATDFPKPGQKISESILWRAFPAPLPATNSRALSNPMPYRENPCVPHYVSPPLPSPWWYR